MLEVRIEKDQVGTIGRGGTRHHGLRLPEVRAVPYEREGLPPLPRLFRGLRRTIGRSVVDHDDLALQTVTLEGVTQLTDGLADDVDLVEGRHDHGEIPFHRLRQSTRGRRGIRGELRRRSLHRGFCIRGEGGWIHQTRLRIRAGRMPS